MEESQGRTEKQPQTDTDTDVESTQSRQKKRQMKSIFLSDSGKEAIVEFIKQYAKLFDKTHDKFKDKYRKEGLWERVVNFQESICQHCQKVVQNSMYQIWQAQSDKVRTSI